MTLDPQAKELLDIVNAFRTKGFHEIGAEKAREAYNTRPANLGPEWIEVFKLINKTIKHNNLSIPIRIYIPIESNEPLPVFTFYHGGGMVIGSLDSYDTLCRQIAVQSGCIVVSVDYRLAPENKFPAAVEDAYAALEWVSQHADSFNGDLRRLAVGGDSAGGSLAAVVAILARDSQINIQFQLLIYPATAPHADHESQLKFAKGYFLERLTILWFHECYIRDDSDRLDFRYAPLITKDLSKLPPTLIIVADHDPLRDEGVAYAKRLKESGVEVMLEEYEGMFHPFLTLAGVLDQGKLAITACADKLRLHLFKKS
ncbi:MAG: acetyl esterase [Cellvibrionaceae bacterium]|jgi:acetyl esterase